jgi:hypothetical protein
VGITPPLSVDTYVALHQIRRAGDVSSRATADALEVDAKKAQPEEVALEVPPKEEVLEECVSARWATTHRNYPKNLNLMQALSAAMHHIVDVTT